MKPLAMALLVSAFATATMMAAPPTDGQGDALAAGAVRRIGTTRLRHGGKIHSVAFSADGKIICSADDYSVAVWDTRTGRCLTFRILPPQHTLWNPTLSQDGTLIACRLENGNLGVQEVESGKVKCDLQPKDKEVHNVAFSNDNHWLVSVDREGSLSLWDLTTGKRSRTWKADHTDGLHAYHAFTPDSKALAQAGAAGVYLWDVESGKELWHNQRRDNNKEKKEEYYVHGLAVSADGKLLAARNYGHVDLFDAKKGQLLREISDSVDASFGPLAFSPDNKTIINGEESGRIGLFDIESAMALRFLKRPLGEAANCFAFSADGKFLVAGGWDHVIRLWDVAAGKEVFPNTSELSGDVTVSLLSDGKLLSRCGFEHNIFNAREEERLATWSREGKSIKRTTFDLKKAHELAISRDFTAIALANGPNYVSPHFRPIPNGGLRSSLRLCDPATGKELAMVADLHCQINRLGFSPDGRFLFGQAANAGPNEEDYHQIEVVYLWKWSSPRSFDKIAELPARYCLSVPVFAGDSQWVAVAAKGSVDFYECETARLLRCCADLPGEVKAVSPSGRVLVCTDDDKRTVTLAELATGKTICKIDFKPGCVHRPCFAFSPDGRILACNLNSQTIFLWDALTGKSLGKLEGHRGEVCSLCFTLNGRYLISGSSDTTILVWDYRSQLPRRAETAELPDKRIEELWQDLQAGDPERGYRAVAKLADAPAQAITLLRKKIPPSVAADQIPFQTWLKELDSDEFKVREKASAELLKSGELAEPLLREALARQLSPEAKRRIEDVLEALPRTPRCSTWLATLRAFDVLESVGAPEAVKLLEEIGGGLATSAQTREASRTLERAIKVLQNRDR
jgi:WD40 repeat protein